MNYYTVIIRRVLYYIIIVGDVNCLGVLNMFEHVFNDIQNSTWYMYTQIMQQLSSHYQFLPFDVWLSESVRGIPPGILTPAF
jgi:hypothetical protein